MLGFPYKTDTETEKNGLSWSKEPTCFMFSGCLLSVVLATGTGAALLSPLSCRGIRGTGRGDHQL